MPQITTRPTTLTIGPPPRPAPSISSTHQSPLRSSQKTTATLLDGRIIISRIDQPIMASNSFRKLPPEVQRELLRHVKPRASRSSSDARRPQSSTTFPKTYYWLAGCTVFVGLTASLPYWATQSIGSLTAKDQPLNASGVRRGAFQNSGSKDAGPDLNWDLSKGRYVYPPGFAEHLKRQDPRETDLGPSLETLAKEAGNGRDDSSARRR